MDLAVRASLRGWEFLYVGDIKEVSIWKKLYMIYSFFFVRKIISHIVTFAFYCIVIPVSVMVPEVSLPLWGVMYIPTTISALNAIQNPRSLHIMTFWILFENVMSMHRMKATLVGLMETGSVNDWVVTEKLGNVLKARPENGVPELTLIRPKKRVYFSELGFAIFLFFCASYDLAIQKDCYYIYIYLQAIAFIVMGFGYAGTSISDS